MRFILSIIFMLSIPINIIANDIAFRIMQKEQRVALVIGNSAYHKPLSILNNTINDARAIKNILSSRGFDVIYRENISKREFHNVLEEFYQKLSKGGVGLLYFSGHGLESSGQNYLIPINANIRTKNDVEFEAVALNRITKQLQDIGNRLNIIILDACRNDPFARSMGIGGLAKTEPIGLFVSYATGAGQVASDGKIGENGLFTKYLIKYMQQPLTLQEVFKKTRKSVYLASSKTQFPAIYDQTINGDFYFTLPTSTFSPKINDFQARQALLVGVDDYEGQTVDLYGVNKDLDRMKKLFTKWGFQVTVLYNKDSIKIEKYLKTYQDTLRKNDIFAFYFSGHGIGNTKGFYKNYIVLNDGSKNKILLNKRLNKLLEKIPSKKLFIIDSAYSFFKEKRSIALIASDSNNFALNSKGGGGIFTYYLFKILTNSSSKSKTIEEVYQELKNKIYEYNQKVNFKGATPRIYMDNIYKNMSFEEFFSKN